MNEGINTNNISEKIIAFPFVPGSSEVGSKIKVIAKLAELRELASRGVNTPEAASRVEKLLCDLVGMDVSILPVSVQVALKNLGSMSDVLDNSHSMAPIEASSAYGEMFDYIASNLNLDLGTPQITQ